MLIPPDSYLRRMQAALAAKTRLELDAIVFASDVISICYARLGPLCDPQTMIRISDYDRVSAIADAWTIVDNIHVIRQLFWKSRKGEMGPQTRAWHTLTETASLLRNGMDHVASNLNNLANRSGSPPPALGAVFIQRTVMHPTPAITCLTLTAGNGIVGAGFNGPVIDTLALEDSVVIEIEAFGHRCSLSAAVAGLLPLLAAMAERAEADVDRSLREQHLDPAAEAGARAVVQTQTVLVTQLSLGEHGHLVVDNASGPGWSAPA